MDPQQRLMLELSWEAFEDAGIVPDGLLGSHTGVFVGAIAGDYARVLQQHGTEAITRHALTGTARAIIANRISYTFGLRGPSMTVDAAQSSALVAVHLACESLHRGESSLAIAGGVNLNIDSASAIAASRFGALSPDGLCFTFDGRANGYVRGEGAGVVILKPLSHALSDGDPIYGVIRGSAVNSDGSSDGLAAPDQQAQEDVLRLAYRQAGIKETDVQYVELHGTGTSLGDRIEAAALGAVLGVGREGEGRLLVGSAKTNIGHLEGAAGIAGMIKAILCVSHGEIAPSLNFKAPSSEIPLDELGLCVQQTLGPWPKEGQPRVVGVSSFGMGGTNCHIVLSDIPDSVSVSAQEKRVPDQECQAAALGMVSWVVSAKSKAALHGQAQRLLEHVEASPELDVNDLGYSLATSRSAFEHRAVILGASRSMLLDGLGALAQGEPAVSLIEGLADGASAEVAFLFPGQGSQWPGMAIGLLDASPVFAGLVNECGDALAPCVDWSLEEVLRSGEGLDRVDVVQPVLFAVMVSLAGLWRECGVLPSVVVGHSQGEIAAACVAGGLSLEDAARIIAARGRALAGLSGSGGMVSVALPAGEVESRLARLGGRAGIAAVNGPSSVVVSGDTDALGELLVKLETEDVRARKIPVDYAAHSAEVEVLREELLEVCTEIEPRSSEVPFCSSVTGGLLDTAQLDGEYWYRNLRETVRFDRAVATALERGSRVFIEASPHPVLTASTEDILDEALADSGEATIVGSLRREQGGIERFLTSLAEVYVRGVDVDWASIQAGTGTAQRVALPTYAFQRRRYWLERSGTDAEGVLAEADALKIRSAKLQETEDDQVPDDVVQANGQDERSLADAPPGAGSFKGSLARRLADVAPGERELVVLDAVRLHVALVLGHNSYGDVNAKLAFKELGFDSPAAVELRNRLRTITALSLPTTLLFDYPTPIALARYIHAEMFGVPNAPAVSSPISASVDERGPIAIVGMSCRYPGGVASPQDLWDLVAQGGEGIGEFPHDRGWNVERLFDPDPDGQGTSYTRHGGFLDGAGDFDAEFFGISPREALAMDPQQRLLLEGAWEAFEDAGIDPASLLGSQTGVFAGVMYQDYGSSQCVAPTELEGLRLTGSTASVVSGRVAYVLGLEGPAVSIDTACSSSLVALHAACQALRLGECSLALAGGVTVLANPSLFIEFSRQRGLSMDGRCRSFGAGADGTGFSEGMGLVVLERLPDARLNGHGVLAIVRGSAVNQDGASNGLTAPNGPSQERVIRRALASAGLRSGDVDVVEAHGTGTKLGDPIEAGALISAYGQDRTAGPIYLGSIKSNIGHTQAAAGVAGVIKMVQAMRHGVLPRTLYAEEPSPHVDWSAGKVELLSRPRPWEGDRHSRRAGISSFGVSGTNAHVILEEAPPPVVAESSSVEGQDAGVVGQGVGVGVLPFLVSGSNEGALEDQAAQLVGFLRGRPELDLCDVAGTLALRRSHLSHRAAVVSGDRESLLVGLDALARGEMADGLVRGVSRGGSGIGSGVAFLFSGQGSQWAGMGGGLWDSSSVFAESMQACVDAFASYLDFSLEDVLRGMSGAASLERVDVVQPALFCVMVSLASLWRSFGVEPSVVMGHSQGEIAAAYVAGALSLDDAVRVTAVRSGVLAEELSGHGGMVSVAVSSALAGSLIEPWGERVSLAAVNGPSSVVVSGELGALRELLSVCESKGIHAKEIPVDYASHSVQIERVEARLLGGLASIEPCTGEIPFYSTTMGSLLDTSKLDGAYWYQNLRRTVQFEEATRALIEDGTTTFIEMSPHPVLQVPVEETTDAWAQDPGAVSTFGSLRREQGGPERFLVSLSEAYVGGVGVDWGSLFGGWGGGRVGLPFYAFQRKRYWLGMGVGVGDAVSLGMGAGEHPLLGAAVRLAGEGGWLFTGRLSLDSHPWVADHAVMDTVLFPGTGFLEMALAATERVGAGSIEELVLEAPLLLGDGAGACQIQLSVSEVDEQGRAQLAVYSRSQAVSGDEGTVEWTRHASGILVFSESPPTLELQGLAGKSWPPRDANELETEFLYDRLAEAGYNYGPAFRGLRRVWAVDDSIYAEVSLEEEHSGTADFHISPALLDAALHASLITTLDGDSSGEPQVPFSFSGIHLHGRGNSSLRVRLDKTTAGSETSAATNAQPMSLVAVDSAGEPLLSIEKLEMRPIDQSALQGAKCKDHDSLFHLEWIQLPTASPEDPACHAAIIGHGQDIGEAPGIKLKRYADLKNLQNAIEQEEAPPPEFILLEATALCRSEDNSELVEEVHSLSASVLESLQTVLYSERLAETKLVLITKSALAVTESDVPNLVQTALPGLLRSAHSEHPEYFSLIDMDLSDASKDSLYAALHSEEPEIAIREGVLFGPRLARLESSGSLVPPVGQRAWHLGIESLGTLEGLTLLANPAAGEVLGAGQVRIAVRAAGLNFRDVLMAIGLYPGEAQIGAEGAGVVVETAPDVEDLVPGDRVMGLMSDAFGPVAIADRKLLVKVPVGWSDAEAASVPIVFLTAYYGLVDMAHLERGETLLLHSAAGGVGMAALQIAAYLGADVFATAHPEKWRTLEGLGIDKARLASSRSLEFREQFLSATGARGVDVVLDSLSGEFVDASFDLLPRGGRFIEMGKTDIRDPEQVGAKYPGVNYRAFDLLAVDHERIQEMFSEIVELFEQGVLQHLPISSFDVREAPQAFRFLRESRHIGKIVLSVPQPLDPDGTILLTGGTGGLGGMLARHLARERDARHLVLASRRGLEAEGALDLLEELQELGCDARIVACDVADRAKVEELVASIPPEWPLTSVIHGAGVLDDGLIGSLDSERLARVMAPKVDAAMNLHNVTKDLKLAEFVLFSSCVGTIGTSGQGNYAAANAFLDALAHYRHTIGLPGISLAFGEWEKATGMTGALSEPGQARLVRLGISAITDEQGLELIDIARGVSHPLLLPVRFDSSVLSVQAKTGMLPQIMRGLVRVSARRSSDIAGGLLATRLAGSPESDWDEIVLRLVVKHVAGVLGQTSLSSIDPGRSFKEVGFDSLAGVELRNRLRQATGLRLPVTLVFDHPTPAAVSKYLLPKVGGSAPPVSRDAAVKEMIASIPLTRLQNSGLLDMLLELANSDTGHLKSETVVTERNRDEIDLIKTMALDGLVEKALEQSVIREGSDSL